MGASAGVLGAFFEDFRRWAGKRKTLKNLRVACFFALLGGSEEVSEHLGGCWLEGYVFGKFFGHVGDKRANSRGNMAT